MSLPVLFLIPARGGSRRVPGKNLKLVAGIPLVAHAIRVARSAARIVPDGPHSVIVTTDDDEIADIATAWHGEVPWRRPAALATPTATSVDVAVHALDALEAEGRRYRAVVLIQATSPLTEASDVAAAVAALEDASILAAVTVVATHPEIWHLATDPGGRLAASGGSSDAGLIPAGAAYAIRPDALRSERGFLVPGATVGIVVRPESSVDVDEPVDLVIAEAIARSRPSTSLVVGGRSIGDLARTFVIAEAGVNHDGDVAFAHRLVDAAADAGADAVKFQTFDPLAVATVGAPLAEYQAHHGGGTDQREMLARLALPADAWRGLQRHAVERGIVFLSSPFDRASADLLDALDVSALKVASGELTNHPFLRHLAAKGRPLLVSTGMADIREVADALDVIADAGDPPVALFHCVSTYPADPSDANLRAIGTLRAAFRRPTGWSDHSLGIELPTAAVSLGAALVEKHLTLDRTRAGPDHRASLEPADFARMVAAIRTIEVALGDGVKVPSEAELATARVARRSLYWGRDLAAGRRIDDDDLIALRPGTGISPAHQAVVVGRRTRRTIIAGSPVVPDDLETAG